MRNSNRKGIEPIIATVILIVIVIAVGVLVAVWQPGFLRQQTDALEDQAGFKLRCQRSGVEIVGAKFFCNNNCAAGVNHQLNITLRNTGDFSLRVLQGFFKKTGAGIYTFGYADEIGAGVTKEITNTSSESCEDFVRKAESVHALTICPDVAGALDGSEVEWLNCP